MMVSFQQARPIEARPHPLDSQGMAIWGLRSRSLARPSGLGLLHRRGTCNVSTNRSNRYQPGSLLSNAGGAFTLIATVACMEVHHPAVAADDEGAERKPLASVTTNCSDCGVVRAIREVRTEREAPRPDVYV